MSRFEDGSPQGARSKPRRTVRWRPPKDSFAIVHESVVVALAGDAVALHVYVALVARDGHRCVPSYRFLADYCGVSDRTVKRCMSRLIELGVVERVHQFKDGRQIANLYRLVPLAVRDKELGRYSASSATEDPFDPNPAPNAKQALGGVTPVTPPGVTPVTPQEPNQEEPEGRTTSYVACAKRGQTREERIRHAQASELFQKWDAYYRGRYEVAYTPKAHDRKLACEMLLWASEAGAQDPVAEVVRRGDNLTTNPFYAKNPVSIGTLYRKWNEAVTVFEPLGDRNGRT